MIIIKTKGGLGNQMFQYAFGRVLSLKLGTELALDTHQTTNIAGLKKDIERPFELDKFNIAAHIATPSEIGAMRNPLRLYLNKIWRKLTRHDYYKFNPSSLNAKDGTYFEGYWWQSEKYFKSIRDTLLKELTLKNPHGAEGEKIAQMIQQSPVSVSIHIRRGDYATDPATTRHHGLTTPEYYKYAIDRITQIAPTSHFFIFSDDIEYAKKALTISSPHHFVSGSSIPAHEELILMSRCTHHIIANSSFSWWSAWLGTAPDKIVIAPNEWLADSSINTSDICPESWIRI